MNVVSLTVGKEFGHDTKEFRKLLYPVVGRASSVYGDGAYDSRKNFQYFSNKGVSAVIPTRSNARLLSRSSGPARGRVEIFFSALKRTVGEVIMANKLVYQIQEAIMKIYAYFLIRKNTVVN